MDGTGVIELTKGDSILKPKRRDVGRYLRHLQAIQASWNKWLKRYLPELSFSAKNPLSSKRHDILSQEQIVRFLRGNKDGIVHDNQIRTTIEIIVKVLKRRGHSGICIGPTNCGKTGTSNNLRWLGPILALLTGERYQVITLIPDKKGLENQARDECKRFLALYGNCEIIYKGRSFSLNDYENDLVKRKGIKPYYALRRSNGRKFQEIIDRCKVAHKQNCKVAYLMDEIHWGAGTDGMQAKILNTTANQLLASGQGDFIIGFSATPWEQINLKQLWQVGHRLSDTYCGYNYFNGKLIDDEATILEPVTLSLAQAELRYGLDGFRDISRSLYWNEEKFYKERERKKLPISHRRYRELVANSIASAINHFLIEERYGLGLLVRFSKRNDDVDEFAQALRNGGLHKEIEVIHYYSDNVKTKIRRVIRRREGFTEKKPYIILATGGARMGDNFPPEVKIGFDFTEQTTYTALFQATLGRLCGNLKSDPLPIVIMSEKAKNTVDIFVRTKGCPHKSPSARTIHLAPQSPKPKSSVTIRREDLQKVPTLAVLLEDFERRVLSRLPKDSEKLVGHRKYGQGFWSEFFTEDRLRQIESLFSQASLSPIHILRPGEIDHSNKGWYGTKSDARVGFRRAWGPSAANSNLPSDRYEQGGSERKKETVFCLDPQVHVHKPKGKTVPWKLAAIRLRLQKPAVFLQDPFEGGVLPNINSTYHSFATQTEKKLIDTHSKGKD